MPVGFKAEVYASGLTDDELRIVSARLSGQREDYLLKSLREYKSNARAGYDPAMNEVAQEVKEADIPLLARYLNRFRQ